MGSWEQRIASFLHAFRLDSIKNRILAFAVLATLIPSLTTTWLSYTHNKRALTEKITAQLQNISSYSARETDLWLKERFYDMRVFSASFVVSENLDRILRTQGTSTVDTEALRRLEDYLTSVRERSTDYEELSVIDTQASVVASTGSPTELRLPEDWLSQVAKDEEIRGDTYWDEALQQIVMMIAWPIKAQDGRFLGAVAAQVHFHTIDRTLRGVALGETGHAYLLGKDGTIMVSSRILPAALMNIKLAPRTFRELSALQRGSIEYTDAQGNDVVGTLDHVSQPDWAVVAEITREEAFVQILELRNQTIVMVSTLLLSIGLIAYVLGIAIVRPLDRLTIGAAQVAGGNLDVDLPVVTRGELGSLTRVFNDMVARLRHGRGELERLSVIDGLTGLYNRNHLVETIAKEVARSDRQEEPFAAMMIDLDHFKKYNDTYGHLGGDKVLVKMSAIFSDCIREVDYAARYGGEEFLILLPQTDLEGGVEVAERIQNRLADTKLDDEKKKVGITLSIGVAEFPQHGDTAEAIIAAADAALYLAKRRGRNRVARATANKRRPATRPRGKQARKRA